MSVDGAIYGAVLIAISSSVVATGIGAWVVWKIYRSKQGPRPIAGLLLIVILAMAIAQGMEQTRVLFFRLSYDQLLLPGIFQSLYTATWNVVSSKLLMAMAVSAGSMLQLALYCRRDEHETLMFVMAGWLGAFLSWVFLSTVLEIFL